MTPMMASGHVGLKGRERPEPRNAGFRNHRLRWCRGIRSNASLGSSIAGIDVSDQHLNRQLDAQKGHVYTTV